MVAINSLTMLVLYGVLGGYLLGWAAFRFPWQALLLSISVCWMAGRRLVKRRPAGRAQAPPPPHE